MHCIIVLVFVKMRLGTISVMFIFYYFSGVHLKDLILLHTALPDKIDSNLVNFRKMAQLSNIFTHLMQVQNAVLPLEANIDLVNTIRASIWGNVGDEANV